MKILIHGLTNRRGLPLAAVLRLYGRHSVVACGIQPPPPGGHPDPELHKALLENPELIPLAPSLSIGLRECHDLAFISGLGYRGDIHDGLRVLAHMWRARRVSYGLPEDALLPAIIVCPTPDGMQFDRPEYSGLLIGLAPFDYDSRRVTDRLLGLRRIAVRRTCDREPGRLEQLVSETWKWVSNYTEIVEIPA